MKKGRRLNFYEMKNKITLLEELLKRNAEPHEYIPVLKKMVNKVSLRAMLMMQEFIWRGRKNEKNKLFNNISEVTYPKNVEKKGRLNNINERILYAANGELGTLIEMDLERYSFFTISKLKLANKGIVFIPIGVNEDNYYLPPKTKAEELLLNYFNSEITKRVTDRNEYNSTIALAHLFFKDPVMNCREGKVSGIIYPSIKSRMVSNKITYNYAIIPEIFDSCFVFDEIYTYCITQEKHQKLNESIWQMNAVNRVIKINNDGSLEWQFDFNEMKNRVARGVDLFDTSCDNLRGREKYL